MCPDMAFCEHGRRCRPGIWPDVAVLRRGGYGSRGSAAGDDGLGMLGMRPDTADRRHGGYRLLTCFGRIGVLYGIYDQK